MSEEKLVAIVNGKEISRQDVLKFLNDMGPQMAMQFKSPEGIKQVIDEMVNQELLYLDAKDSKIDEEDEFINTLELTKVNLLKNYAFNKILQGTEATQEEVLNYYNTHKNDFHNAESVKASHILVDTEEKANNILDEISNGLSFEDAAKKYSTCPSNEVGGDLGQFSRGQMVPEFENEAFSMEVGTVSKPVKTQFGYHLIKLVEKHPESESTFEEAVEEIYHEVLRLKQQRKYFDKINELKGKYEVQYISE